MHEGGTTIRQIARAMGMNRETVRRYVLRQAAGAARRHAGEQLTDPRQQNRRVLTGVFVE
jgi:transposase-like protein